jgi:diguanylate cyclase (GGDEF)-like protein/PAS domain S-box-containing protein
MRSAMNAAALGRSLRALVVDDDAPYRDSIRTILREASDGSAEFECAGSLAEARLLLVRERCDVILLDLCLSDGDGLDLLEDVRSLDHPPSVIVLTAGGDEELAARAIQMGAAEYLIKTRLSARDLESAVRRVLARREEEEMRRRAEEALREGERRFRRLVELSPEAIVVHCDGRIVFINPTGARLLGAPGPEALIGCPVLDFVHPDDRERVRQRIGRLEASDASVEAVEERFVRLDGRVIDVEVAAMALIYQGHPAIQAVFRDVTERKEAERALRASEERYRQLFERNLAAVFRIGLDGSFAAGNDACARILGCVSREELLSSNVTVFFDDASKRTALFELLRREGAMTSRELELRRSDGERIWVLANVSLVRGEGDRPFFEGTMIDITARKVAERRIEYLAFHDALTDLPNRILFQDRLTAALAHAHRSGSRLAVMYLDLDDFKRINDTLGHEVGDRLLQLAAERLRRVTRAEDTVARVGGDEFTLLLSRVSRSRDAVRIARKILDALVHPFELEGYRLYLSTSIGISLYPEDGENAETLLKNADYALYRAKELGRNRYEICTPESNREVRDRLDLENDLRAALEAGKLSVVFQPLFDARTGRVTGAETLLRWSHPQRGWIDPSELIAVAEQSHLIVPLGEWVLEEACRQMRSWSDAGFQDLRVCVNLSGRQIQRQDLPRMVSDVLSRTGLDAGRLEFEITESTAMQNEELTAVRLAALRELGVHLALDDFGTGHSSLASLKRLPIHALKIDRTFVQDAGDPAEQGSLLEAIITMAHSLGLRVVAEGVETAEQLSFLARHGCEEVQGHFLSEPRSVESFEAILREAPSWHAAAG